MHHHIRILQRIDALHDLAYEADAEGYRFLRRLITEWHDGTNRFNKPGERIIVAMGDERIIGVCGLNIDPYTDEPRIGRLRHLYVSPDVRRQGVASQLERNITASCHIEFSLVRLRTHNPEADAFYTTIGYERVYDDPHCTHQNVIVCD